MSKPQMVMNYVKVKSMSGVRALVAHNLRMDGSNNVDSSRTNLNINSKNSGSDIGKTMDAFKDNLRGHTPRKNAVHAHSYVISGSSDHMNAMSRKDCVAFFNDTIKFFKAKYGDESLCISSVHFDEKTPHMHLIIQPMHKGKLASTHFMGGKKDALGQLRTDLHREVASKYGLERGEPTLKGDGKPTPTNLSEHYKLVNNELPELQEEAEVLRAEREQFEREALDAKIELQATKKELNQVQGQVDELKRSVSDLESLRGQSHTMTRDELSKAIERLDEQEYRPAVRRH